MGISFYFNPSSNYPGSKFYNPGKLYPEYPFDNEEDIREKNDIYEMVREIFILHGLDAVNIGKRDWNPLGNFIKPGNTVLIKPNLVRDINEAEKEYQAGMECLITHPSVVRCLFDYAYIALKGCGRIIVADAPVQGCNYNNLLCKTGYGELFDFFEGYQTSDLRIETADLRECIMEFTNRNRRQVANLDKKFESTIVDLGNDSYFYHVKKKRGLRVTGYVGTDTVSHHRNGKNEYCISNAALIADVIINIPKPKTHRIAGYTGALKNLIGINARKEFLPHHTKGSICRGGDEYEHNHFRLKAVNSLVNDYINVAIKKQNMKMYTFLNNMGRLTGKRLDSYEKNRRKKGMWYGNDTIWRTILDINKIILYADKNGVMKDEPQRKIISLGDMIVCGEKEGPLQPNYKYVGGLVFSDNAVLFDLFVVKIMGFDYNKFKVLLNAMKDKKIYDNQNNEVNSNCSEFKDNIFKRSDKFQFLPTDGWREYLN